MIDDKFIQQYVVGNNNRVAKRDIIEYHYNPYPIRFFEEDIKDVIMCFADKVQEINNIIDSFNDVYRPDIEVKNELNNLSKEYFNLIKENSLRVYVIIPDMMIR